MVGASSIMSTVYFAAATFIVLFTVIFRKFSRRAYRRVKDCTTDINTYLSENLSGIKITQIFNQEDRKLSEFLAKSEALRRAKQNQTVVFGIFRPMVYMLYISSVLCLMYLGNTILASGAMNLNYNYDDLAETVTTTSGTLNLSTLYPTVPAPPTVPTIPNQPGTIKTNNRVEIYANSAGEMVYTAYNGTKVKVSITVSNDGLKILNTTNDVRLSDTLKGVKFMGIDSSYNVYMYETNGTLYRFVFGSWYSAEKIVLDGNFKTMRIDENGFLSTIITDKTTYSIKQLTPSTKWEASYTYAVTKDVYATLYTKGSAKSTTLMLIDGILTLNGKEVDDKVTAFGFISDTKFCYIRNGKAYTAPISDPTDYHRLCSDAVSFKMNDVGLVTKIVLSTGKVIKVA